MSLAVNEIAPKIITIIVGGVFSLLVAYVIHFHREKKRITEEGSMECRINFGIDYWEPIVIDNEMVEDELKELYDTYRQSMIATKHYYVDEL